ncbi:MAG: PAS domain S-box protein [Terriglobia bacterium]|jgi:PAS domain S-box-containing protein
MDVTKPDGLAASRLFLRVLILEDNPRDAKLIASVLEGGGFGVQCEVTDSAESFRERLEKADYDVILADFNLRNWTALDALEILKRSGKDIPLIVVTGTLGDEHAVECIKQGAADFVLKDRPARLPTAVQRALQEKRLREERQWAEEELRKSERKYRQLHESMIDGFVRVDMEGRITEANDAFCRMLGYTPEELLKSTWKDLTPEKWHVSETDIIEEQVLTRGYSEIYLKEYQQKEGAILPVEVRKYLMLDESGNPCGMWAIVRDITERKWAEEMLQEYEKVVEGSDEMIAVVDREYRYLLANRAYLDQHGLERGDVVGSSVPEVLGEEFSARVVKEKLDECFQGNVVRYEIKHQYPKLGERDILASHFPIEGSHGVDRAACVLQDITERKRAEEALRDNEEKYRVLYESSRDAIMMLAPPEWEFTAGNPAAIALFGARDKREFVAAAPWSLSPEYQPDGELSSVKAPQMIDAAMERGSHSFEWTHKKFSGEEFFATVTLTRMIYRGQPLLQATVRDITERKRAEAEHTQLITAIEQSAEAVVITNTNGDIEYVNPAFTWITGYSREEVLGQNPRILKSGKQDPGFYQQLWATILQGEIWHGELINRKKDGSLYTEEMNIAPVRSARGEVTHFIATKQDVTGRKTLEAQLQQAAKMEAIGRLAGGVAHDFNNLLTIINGYAELLLDKFAADNQVGGQLKQIQDAGERAASLTRQLLAFSRRQVLASQVLDLNAVVSNVEKMLRRLIGEDVKLHTFLDPSLGRVKADPGQIEQVIMNLAVNARDAMPSGGNLTLETSNVELDEAYARTHATVKPGPHVMLAVSDSGVGMTPEAKTHIFEPFFTTKEKGKGTGLGLATVYGIVKQSGGSIWVYSELGQGTVFKIYLPTVSESPAARGHAKTETDTASGSETILVVEDEQGVRSLVRLALESSGYKVLEMADAESALAACANYDGPIHLLLTDVVMPQMSGPVVAEKVAALRPGIKVLFMSGYTDDAVVRHGVLSHDMPFIQKPFSPLALRKKIREVLGGK